MDYIYKLMGAAKIYLLKGVVLILLGAILQTYACSVLCSAEGHWLCNERHTEKDCSKDHHDESKGDCQENHMAFLQTVGQFHSYDIISLSKLLPHDEMNNLPLDVIQPFTSNNKTFGFTGFHPPPPKDGIPVLVQSFLI